jgi:hypothetical protein
MVRRARMLGLDSPSEIKLGLRFALPEQRSSEGVPQTPEEFAASAARYAVCLEEASSTWRRYTQSDDRPIHLNHYVETDPRDHNHERARREEILAPEKAA